MAVTFSLVTDALLGCRQANLCFHFAASGDPEDYMKHFLQLLVVEIAEVQLKTTFPTSCRGHFVLCTGLLFSLWLGVTREDHQISQTRHAATHNAPWSFLFST